MTTTLRRALPAFVGVALLVLFAILSPAVGAKSLPIDQVISVLWQPDDSAASVIVWGLRMPRVLLGAAVGIALGAAGALGQAVTRNPLADPGLLGVNAGASVAVAMAITFGGVSHYLGFVAWGVVGATVAAVIVITVGAAARIGDPRTRLVLTGVALSAMLTSVTSALTVTDSTTLNRFRIWTVGSLAGRGWEVAVPTALCVAILLLLVTPLIRDLGTAALGDDVARALGAHVVRTRWLVVGGFAALSGVATAAAGPIGFVGLIVPHLARIATGPALGWNVAGSAALGGALVLASDIVGRVAVRPGELDVSIVLACIGTPVFLLLIVKTRRRRASTAKRSARVEATR